MDMGFLQDKEANNDKAMWGVPTSDNDYQNYIQEHGSQLINQASGDISDHVSDIIFDYKHHNGFKAINQDTDKIDEIVENIHCNKWQTIRLNDHFSNTLDGLCDNTNPDIKSDFSSLVNIYTLYKKTEDPSLFLYYA